MQQPRKLSSASLFGYKVVTKYLFLSIQHGRTSHGLGCEAREMHPELFLWFCHGVALETCHFPYCILLFLSCTNTLPWLKSGLVKYTINCLYYEFASLFLYIYLFIFQLRLLRSEEMLEPASLQPRPVFPRLPTLRPFLLFRQPKAFYSTQPWKGEVKKVCHPF